MRGFLTAHLRGYKGLEIHLGCHTHAIPTLLQLLLLSLFPNAFLHFVFALSYIGAMIYFTPFTITSFNFGHFNLFKIWWWLAQCWKFVQNLSKIEATLIWMQKTGWTHFMNACTNGHTYAVSSFIESTLIWILKTVLDGLLLWTLAPMDSKMSSNRFQIGCSIVTHFVWQSFPIFFMKHFHFPRSFLALFCSPPHSILRADVFEGGDEFVATNMPLLRELKIQIILQPLHLSWFSIFRFPFWVVSVKPKWFSFSCCYCNCVFYRINGFFSASCNNTASAADWWETEKWWFQWKSASQLCEIAEAWRTKVGLMQSDLRRRLQRNCCWPLNFSLLENQSKIHHCLGWDPTRFGIRIFLKQARESVCKKRKQFLMMDRR